MAGKKKNKTKLVANFFSVYIILALFLLICLVFMILFFKTRNNSGLASTKLINTPYSPSQTPLFIPSPTSPPLVFTEKTYVNNKYGYSFVYLDPGDYTIKVRTISLLDDKAEIHGMDSLIIKIEPIVTVGSDIQKWLDSQMVEPYTDKPLSCFEKQYVTEIRSLYDSTKTIIRFPEKILMMDNFQELKQNTDTRCNNYGQVRVLVIPHNNYLLKITYDWATESEKILSSFKFTQ